MLSDGTKLGRYVIRAKIGEGGMGEVYLAEDTQLERKVAVKILPNAVAEDAARMQRFVREAKAASALNHPHIAHIYEIGESEGTNFIAMEFIEGTSLRETIHREMVDLRTRLRYLTQVAEGLAKAHSNGIVHRDLKPDNVMISKDGYSKILDFGLAKLVKPESPPDAGSNELHEAATALLPEPLSTPGMIMGTIGYMSPEQVRGRRDIDQRADIFAFGCILYEAATGQQPFAGDTTIDCLHKIIHAQPPPIKEFNAEAPADLQRIVRRCLQKDPEERYQTIKDIAIELRELQREMEDSAVTNRSVAPSMQHSDNRSGESPDSTLVGQPQETRDYSAARPTSSAEYVVSRIRKHKRAAFFALAVTMVVLGAAGYAAYRLSTKPEKRAISFANAKLTRLTTIGRVTRAVISPDGKYVVHVVDDAGQQSLRLRQVATTSDQEILPPAPVAIQSLTFTPDGNYIYYAAGSRDAPRGVLYSVPTLGGEPRRILTNLSNTGTSFSPDGKQFAFTRTELGKEAVLMIANADGSGEKKLVVRHQPIENIGSPAWSPDGKTIAFASRNSESNDATIFVAEVADGSVKQLTSQRWFRLQRVVWLPDGTGLLMRAPINQQAAYFQIWHVSYPDGETRRLTNDLNNYSDISLTADSSTLAAIQSEPEGNIWVGPAGDAVNGRQITSGSGKVDGGSGVSWTPDGRIVFNSITADVNEIWIIDSDGKNLKQLTANSRLNSFPSVSPDGRHIFFLSDRTGSPHIWRIDVDGANPMQLTNGTGEQFPDCSPDGRWVIYQNVYGKPNIWRVPAEGGESVRLTSMQSFRAAVSPDGKSIAFFVIEEGGPLRIAIMPIEGGPVIKTLEVPPTISGGVRLQWTPDGRAVAYIDTREGVSNIWALPVDGGAPKQLTDFKYDRIFWFDFSRDGKQLALSRGTITSDVVLIKDFR